MMGIIFATNDARDAAKRLRESNRLMSDSDIKVVADLVEAGALRVGDNNMHVPGSVFAVRDLTEEETKTMIDLSSRVAQDTVGRGNLLSAADDVDALGPDRPHADYPHEPGYLDSCVVCRNRCHCDLDAVARGEHTECVFEGHDQ